ncbi:MAG: hypothetical protein ABIS23_01550 [Sphingomicrobium sp.]
MATLASDTRIAPGRADVVRFALTGALAATSFFFLCWVGAFLPFGPATHMYLQLFTSADVNSGLALWQGLCWSLAFGLIAGGLIALSYKLVAAVDGR